MKIGFTCGAFDLVHAGHVLMFNECKDYCDFLIVGLQEDPSIDREEKNKPIMSLAERMTILESNRNIDKIITYKTEKDLYEYLSNNENLIDIRFIGEDWKGKQYTGHDLPIYVQFNSREHGYSSSELRKRIKEAK